MSIDFRIYFNKSNIIRMRKIERIAHKNPVILFYNTFSRNHKGIKASNELNFYFQQNNITHVHYLTQASLNIRGITLKLIPSDIITWSIRTK